MSYTVQILIRCPKIGEIVRIIEKNIQSKDKKIHRDVLDRYRKTGLLDRDLRVIETTNTKLTETVDVCFADDTKNNKLVYGFRLYGGCWFDTERTLPLFRLIQYHISPIQSCISYCSCSTPDKIENYANYHKFYVCRNCHLEMK